MRGHRVVSDLHAVDMRPVQHRPDLKSKLDPSNLDDFVSLAEMSKKEFEVERYAEIVDKTTIVKKGDT